MPTIFQINLPGGEVLRGQHWPVQNGRANFTMITGMQEYALRYDPLAQYLNSRGIKNVEMKLYPHMRHEIHNEADKETVWKDLGDYILK